MPPSRATVRHVGPSCPSEDELAGFVDASLSAAERLWLETHLDECPLCRAALGHLAALDAPEGPRTVDRYRLDAELGRGGMGVVWRAWDPALEREVAVKLLHPELVDDVRFRQRALREARALARLQHPNVVAVHDVGEAGGELFIATELIDGDPLDRWQRGKPAHAILAVYAQAARGLAAAHALGLVHRDVKPSNILVSRSGRACVGDFGLATSAHPRKSGAVPLLPGQRAEPGASASSPGSRPLPHLTDEGVILGTLAYMAPEQRRGEPVDAAADQYALCMALAEALLGSRPRDGVSAEELAQSGVLAPWPAIARGLAHRPGDRFPELDPLIAALEGAAPTPMPAPMPMPMSLPAWLLPVPEDAPFAFAGPFGHPPPLPQAAPSRSLLPLAASAAFVAAAFVAGSAILVATRFANPRLAAADHAAIAAASAAPAAPPSPPTTPSGAPLPTAATPLPAAWRGSDAGPWRLPTRGRQVTLIEQRRAVITPWDPAERDRLMTVDLDTGAVTPPTTLVPAGAAIALVRRAGDRAIAFGSVADHSAAWELAGTPLTAWRLEVPEARSRRDPHRTSTVLVSPDGSRLVWCDVHTAPTLRDAATLTILRELPERACDDAHFTGEHQLAMRAELEYAPPSLPADVSPPSNFSDSLDTFDANADRALFLTGALLELVDRRTGERRGAEGNREAIRAVAPYRGSVLAFSDQLRLWSAEGLLTVDTRRGDAIRTVARLGRFAIEEDRALWLWDPTDHTRRLLANLPLSRPALAVGGERLWVAVEGGVARSVDAEPAEPWLGLRKGLTAAAVDAAGRVAAIEKEHLHLIDLEAGLVQSWQRLGACKGELRVALGGGRLALAAAGQLVLVESDGSALLPELPRPIDELALAPDGAVVAASGDVVYLWPRGHSTARAWPTGLPAGARVTALGLDEGGEELALGYDTGAVVYAPLDELRRQGTAAPMPSALDERCLRRISPAPLATLVGI